MDGDIRKYSYESEETEPRRHGPSFSVIADASPDAIISIDERGKIVFTNTSVEQVLGYTKNDLMGKNVTMLMPERYQLAHKRALKRFIETGQGRYVGKTVELSALKKDGSEFPMELALSPWSSAGRTFVTGSIRDHSERMQGKADLEASHRTQEALNKLLKLSLLELPLSEQLQQALDIILSAPFMPLEPKGGIFLVEEERPELVLKSSRNLPPTLQGMCGKVPFGECLCGQAAAAGQLIFASGVDERHEHRYEGIVPHGHYVVPIISQAGEGKVLGVIVLYVHAGHVRDVNEENFLLAVSNTLAGVVERRQAQDAVRASEERYRTLFEQSPDAVVTIDPRTAMHIEFNDVAHEQLGYSRDEFNKLRVSDYEALETQEEIQAHIENILRNGRDDFETQHLTKEGDRRDVVVKINAEKLGGRDVLLAIFHDVTEQKRAQAFSDALNRINEDISSTLDFDQIMQRVVEESSKAIGCDRAVIYLREERGWVAKHVYGFPVNLIGARFSDEQAPFACLAANSRQPAVSHKAKYSERQRSKLMARYQIHSLLSVPLFLKEETVGSLMFTHGSATASFSTAEIEFAEKLGTAVSLAIENSRLYAREHRIADRLQDALLTIPGQIHGIEFDSLYRSAVVETAKTGGDFYDLFELEHDKVGVLLGDVSGKGLEATALTSLVKNTIKAYAYQHGSPASIVEMTNAIVEKTSPSETFVTLFFGILDKGSSILTYCSAGHPPPILMRKASKASALSTNNPAVGVFPDSKYADSKVTLGAGDTLVLYTDGVIEARCEKELYGESRLIELLDSLKTGQAKGVPELVLGAIQDYSKCMLFDDIAILAISAVREER